MLANLPSMATFRHIGSREGFEAACFRQAQASGGERFLLEGGTSAMEHGLAWSVHYRIAVDEHWRTTHVRAESISSLGHRTLHAVRANGRWLINGISRPDLDGCVDIDFESSLVTNTLAVHRLDLSSTVAQGAPAAFVRADNLKVERLEQTYQCTARDQGRIEFDYNSSTFDFSCKLAFDGSGVIIDYPGIGRRYG